MNARAMTVAGVMSGTSADGIDVAVVRIAPGKLKPKLTLLAHEAFPFPAALRRAVLAAMDAKSTSTAELARLNWRLGLAYAEAVKETSRKHKMKLDLVGCHGQTLYHQARAETYAGRKFACTWQAGEAQAIAAELGVPVVSNFRPCDMLAGGQGAPLVPLLDYVLFADAKRGRVLQNIGGIANLTAIPAGRRPGQVDCLRYRAGKHGDRLAGAEAFRQAIRSRRCAGGEGNGARAGFVGGVAPSLFQICTPPKTAGREQFGRAYAAEFLAACRRHSKNPNDALATATALTAETIARSYARFVRAKMKGHEVDFIVSGGGARNKTLMQMLAARLEPLGCTVTTSDKFGMPAEAKEAAAFALLAWHTWHRLPGNVPAATGAKRAVVLGQITMRRAAVRCLR